MRHSLTSFTDAISLQLRRPIQRARLTQRISLGRLTTRRHRRAIARAKKIIKPTRRIEHTAAITNCDTLYLCTRSNIINSTIIAISKYHLRFTIKQLPLARQRSHSMSNIHKAAVNLPLTQPTEDDRLSLPSKAESEASPSITTCCTIITIKYIIYIKFM